MEHLKPGITEIADDVKEYVRLSAEWYRLKAIARISDVASSLMIMLVAGILLFAVLFFMSFVLAFYLGDIFNSLYLGFLVVAGLYLLLALMIWLMKDSIIKPKIMNGIVSSLNKD